MFIIDYCVYGFVANVRVLLVVSIHTIMFYFRYKIAIVSCVPCRSHNVKVGYDVNVCLFQVNALLFLIYIVL